MLVVNNLSKTFKNRTIFQQVNLALTSGKIYGFLGPNGCGKSVFFKVISGFLVPTTGTITIHQKQLGKDVDILPELGVLIEKPMFIEHFTHLENLMYLANINKKISKETIEHYIKLLGLDTANTDKVRNYSIGMRQKLAIIQAVMENQQIIILDEPFNGLDKKAKKIVMELLVTLKNEGKLILLTSHIEGDIEQLADEIYSFQNGTIEKGV